MRKHGFAAAALSLLAVGVDAEMYECPDASGVIRYSDQWSQGCRALGLPRATERRRDQAQQSDVIEEKQDAQIKRLHALRDKYQRLKREADALQHAAENETRKQACLRAMLRDEREHQAARQRGERPPLPRYQEDYRECAGVEW